MNMKLQIIYGIFISNGMLFDYLRNVYLSTNYHHLGPSGAFKLWLKANIIENIGKLNQLEYKTNYTIIIIIRVETGFECDHLHHGNVELARVQRIQEQDRDVNNIFTIFGENLRL